MASTTDRRRGNEVPGDTGSVTAKSNGQQTDNSCTTSAANKELDHPVVILKEPLNAQENKENVQIKQLQDKIEELEKRMKDLEEKVIRK